VSFKSWFKRRLGIHLVDGVEVVDLGNVSLERIKEFARNKGSTVLEGDFLTEDGRSVFEAKSGQQFLVNDDGSMVSMGINAGKRVIIVSGGNSRGKPFLRILMSYVKRLPDRWSDSNSSILVLSA